MKLYLVPSDFDAPGCYRLLFPAKQLASHGHHVMLPPYTEGTRIKLEVDLGRDADIYVLQQRKEKMWAQSGVGHLRHKGKITVADIDDNYLELPAYNPAFSGTHPYRVKGGSILNREERRSMARRLGAKVPPNNENREYMHAALMAVDWLTVSTPYLAEVYSKLNANVKVLRNYLDWDIWETVKPQCDVERKRTRIGYLGVFKYREADLGVIRPFMGKFMERHPEVDFVANSPEVHEFLQIPKRQRIVVPEYPFRPKGDTQFPVGTWTAVCDIGLVPMVSNGLNLGKSHLKGMEYNAAGIPFVASPMPSYTQYWCDDGVNGFIAHREKDWVNYLELLLSREDKRREMGRWGRARARANTYQEHWTEWEDFYLSLIGDDIDSIARGSVTKGAVQKTSEIGGLLRFLAGRKLDTVVEVGSARGGTLWAFAQIAAPDALLVSVDIPSGSPLDQRGGKDVYRGRNRQRIKTFKLPGQRVELIDANSQLESTRDSLEEILDGRKIDLLFIDADHRYEGVARDLALYSPLVAEEGVVGFHDIISQWDKRAQVDRLWSEIKGKYESYEFIGKETWGYKPWGGIGVICPSRSTTKSAKPRSRNSTAASPTQS